MAEIVVNIADGRIAREPDVLVSYALGSCVGICLYDESCHIAGMAHILLPSREKSINRDNPYKFADSGLQCLLESMMKLGARKVRLRAKVAGGAEMFQNAQIQAGIGALNVLAVKEALKKTGIPIVGEDTGDHYGRTIRFYSQTGKLEIHSVSRDNKKIL